MNRPPNRDQGAKVFLYIIGIAVGIALLLSAIVVFLLGVGVISQIPTYVIWAIILFAVGIGILSGVSIGR